MDYLKVYCDGGSRGNPGPSGIGVVIISGCREKKFKQYLGKRTNNQAEYEAVIFALNLIKKEFKATKKAAFYLDSELVVKQINSEYKVKNEELGRLLLKIKNFIIQNNLSVIFYHIRREKNYKADKLVNEAIDKRIL